jgi:predicted GTPase
MFNINLALVGPVSSGKTTLLNTMLQSILSDMNVSRTTMLPQVFTETFYPPKINSPEHIRNVNRTANENIISKKVQLTIQNCIEIEHYILKNNIMTLPNNVYLNIYDLPGLNDAETEDIYFEYLKRSMHKFDIIVLIVDIKDAFTTSSGPPKILTNVCNYIKSQSHKYKLIVLINKCDDMEIQPHSTRLILHQEYYEIYNKAVEFVENKTKDIPNLETRILPIATEDAFICRLYKKNPQIQLDSKYLNRYGVNEMGKSKWGRLSLCEKQDYVLKNMTTENYQEQLIRSGFYGFQETLRNDLLTKNNQREICEYRLKEEVELLPPIIKYDIEALQTYISEVNKLNIKCIIIFNVYKSVSDNCLSKIINDFKKYFKSMRIQIVDVKSDSDRLNLYCKLFNLIKSELESSVYSDIEEDIYKVLHNITRVRQDCIIKRLNATCVVPNTLVDMIPHLENLKKQLYTKEQFHKLLCDKINGILYKKNTFMERIYKTYYSEKETPVIQFCKYLSNTLLLDKCLIFNFYCKYLLNKHCRISNELKTVSLYSSYHYLVQFKIQNVQSDSSNISEDFDEYLMNLLIINKSHASMIQLKPYNYVQHSEVILSEFTYLMEIYKKEYVLDKSFIY